MMYKVTLIGCDDQTDMFIDLTDEQVTFLEMLSKLSKETSSYLCMPTLEIARLQDERNNRTP